MDSENIRDCSIVQNQRNGLPPAVLCIDFFKTGVCKKFPYRKRLYTYFVTNRNEAERGNEPEQPRQGD